MSDAPMSDASMSDASMSGAPVSGAPMSGAPVRRRREPVFNVPVVITVCCVVLLGIHALRLALSNETDNWLIATFAFIPARVTLALHLAPDQLAKAYQATVGRNAILAAQIDFLLGEGQLRIWTLITYAFLHASWAHVGFNCVWLVAFGSAVARRFSTISFLVLLFAGALAGALLQYAVDFTSFQMVIGASAAVSAAMGAAVRFVFRPSEEPQRIFDRAVMHEAFRQPALSLRQVFTTKAALVFLVFWFATDLLFGIFPSLSGVSDAPVAWQAHIGGFLAGLLLFPLLDPRRRQGPAHASALEQEDTTELALGRDEPPVL